MKKRNEKEVLVLMLSMLIKVYCNLKNQGRNAILKWKEVTFHNKILISKQFKTIELC